MDIDNTLKYETSDLWVAAFLRTQGVKLKNTRSSFGKYFFIFDDMALCKKLISEYFEGALVPAIELKSSINFFKDRIFSG